MDLIVSPAVVALNTQSGAPKPVMTAGQLIDALVLQLIDPTTVRLAIADSVIDVKTEVPLEPGTHVRLAVRGHGDDVRWVIVGVGASISPLSKGTAPVQQSLPPPHAGLPATEVKIGNAAPSTDSDVALPGQVKPDQTQPAPRLPPPGAMPAAEFAIATRLAAARQSGLAPVFAELKALAAAPDLPPAVRRVATQILSAPATLDEASGDNLRQAISRSGLFFEARLAGEGRGSPPLQAGDLKAALLMLRTALQGWLDTLPATPAVAAPKADAAGVSTNFLADVKAMPPPYRGAPTAGQQPIAVPSPEQTAPPDLARALIVHTDGAIARQVLMQVASLPDAGNVSAAQVDTADIHWNLEIPFVTPQGTAVAHFEVQRDGRQPGARQSPAPPAWRANFSLDFEPIGPVHTQIALTGKRAAVRIWAERPDTAEMLRAGAPHLTDALRAAALDAGEIVVSDGIPPRPLKANPGRFLDRAS